jgi:hypothetical protein
MSLESLSSDTGDGNGDGNGDDGDDGDDGEGDKEEIGVNGDCEGNNGEEIGEE